MNGLTEGRMVHYVLPHHPECRSVGQHRPALVVKVWGEGSGYPPEEGVINIGVFTDYANDYYSDHEGYNGHFWATSVKYDENKEPGTWHWIEQA